MARKVIHICDACKDIDTHKEDLKPLKYVHPFGGLVTIKACGLCHEKVADTVNQIMVDAEERP